MLRLIGALFLAVAMIACGTKGPPVLTLDQVPDALKTAFATAKTSLLKTNAESIAKLVAEKQYALASLQLQALTANTDLTDEQRNTVAGATVAVNAALQELAASATAAPLEETASPQAKPDAPQPSNEDAAAAAAALQYHIRTK